MRKARPLGQWRGVRNTTIPMTPDRNHSRRPNAWVFGRVMLNYPRNPSRRFNFKISVGVNENLVRAQSLGIDELQRIEGVMDMPKPIYRVQLHAVTKTYTGNATAPMPQARNPGASTPVDTRAHKGVRQQIDTKKQAHPQNDLLDPAAPRE